MESDVLQEFLAESWSGLVRLEDALASIVADPPQAPWPAEFVGALRAMTGTCGFIGLKQLATLARGTERLLNSRDGREHQVTPEARDLLGEAAAELRHMLEHLKATGREPASCRAGLIARLDRFCGSPVADRPADSVFDPCEPIDTVGQASPLARTSEDACATEERTLCQTAPTPALNDCTAGNVESEDLPTLIAQLTHTRDELLDLAAGENPSRYAGPLARLDRLTCRLEEFVSSDQCANFGSGSDDDGPAVSVPFPRPVAVGRRVLVIDDSLFFRVLVSTALERQGCEVTAVDGAAEAVAVIESGAAFGAVVSDIDLPGTTGLEFAAWFRSRCGSETPLIALSGSPREAEALAAGFDRFLPKLQSHRLAATLSALCDHPRTLHRASA